MPPAALSVIALSVGTTVWLAGSLAVVWGWRAGRLSRQQAATASGLSLAAGLAIPLFAIEGPAAESPVIALSLLGLVAAAAAVAAYAILPSLSRPPSER